MGRVYGILFGAADLRRSRERENQFALEIRREVPFLFEDLPGTIETDETRPHPRPFDYAVIIVALPDLLLRFTRGRGDLRVQVAPKTSRSDWAELRWLLSIVNESDVRPSFLYLSDVARVLKPNMDRIRAALSGERGVETWQKCADMRDYERVVAKQWSAEINRRLYDH